MQEFIDETASKTGTPLNRKNMMAIQGFTTQTTTFNKDGSITQINSDGQVLTTTFNSDGSIVEKFVGEKTITKITRFDSNGNVSEVVS